MSHPVFLETDWFTDVDDVMAMRVLLNLQRAGALRILGIGINARYDESVVSLDAFLQAHGVDIPVAIVQDWTGGPSNAPGPSYQLRLAKMPSKYRDNTQGESPVRLWRRLLAAATEPVDVLSIGFAENLQALLASGPDEFSPLGGRELVARHGGQLWMMGGALAIGKRV